MQREKFSHFLLTQFNLRNFPKSSNQDHDQWLNWTRARISLFKTYCLPSILNQTVKNFTWLIYFDSGTPKEFEPFIEELAAIGFIKICFCDGNENFVKNYLQEVKLRIRPEEEWIITTRLDNDDALHKSAIEVIQKNFLPKDKYLIALASGYVMDIERKTMAHYFYPMSPFISLVESLSDNPIGIFAKPHTQWPSLRLFLYKEIFLEFFRPSKRQARFILKSPLWIQIFHGKNVSNSFYRGLPVLKTNDLSEFGLSFLTVKMNFSELPKFWNYVFWKRYFKCWVIKVIINK